MPENTETALDAVNAALEGPTHDEPADTSPEVADDTVAGEVDETSPDTDGDTTPDAVGEGEGVEGDEVAAGRERDPATGKFVPKSAEKPAGEKQPEGSKPDAAKKPDPVNDPIPKDLKGPTQERIRSLIGTAKELTAERDKISTDFNYMVQGIQATGASPKQYGETLSWLALFNSNDPTQQEKALELVESVADRLATFLGKERTVNDPLSAHADLKEAVRTGKVTSQYANEIARTRNSSQFRSSINDTQRQQQEQQQSYDNDLATARNDLTALEGTLQGLDKDWAQKKPILVAALKPVFAMIPPSQWKAKFEEAYRNMPTIGRPAAPRVPDNQPLRAGKNPAGAQVKAPTSMAEAIDGALAGLASRR